jgi:hypothetical protein
MPKGKGTYGKNVGRPEKVGRPANKLKISKHDPNKGPDTGKRQGRVPFAQKKPRAPLPPRDRKTLKMASNGDAVTRTHVMPVKQASRKVKK